MLKAQIWIKKRHSFYCHVNVFDFGENFTQIENTDTTLPLFSTNRTESVFRTETDSVKGVSASHTL